MGFTFRSFIKRVEDRAKILQHRLLDMMKPAPPFPPLQREYEEKMIDMFIEELNKKGKENNES